MHTVWCTASTESYRKVFGNKIINKWLDACFYNFSSYTHAVKVSGGDPRENRGPPLEGVASIFYLNSQAYKP